MSARLVPRVNHMEGSDGDDGECVIAILDTGVDPSAQGLQVTSRNRPKIIDLVDCTGAGDIRMAEVEPREPEPGFGFVVTGGTGRDLKIPKEWGHLGAKKFRVGFVHAYSLFPKSLVGEHRSKRFESFEKVNRDAEMRLSKEGQEITNRKDRNDDDFLSADYELRLKELQSMTEKYSNLDVGPVFDAIMFVDAEGFWRIALDKSCCGDLTSSVLMKEYRFDREFGTFGSELLTYSFNVYDDGDTLSVVTTSGAHGTHVAGICAAHFPDNPHLDGINPAASIISFKIGDTRLGSMETSAALMRAFTACINQSNPKVDIVNMSYGEPTSMPNKGRIIDLLREMVNQHKIIFVGSAGNAGPALSTVGAPGGTTDSAISVGAYVSPEMAEQLYSSRESMPQAQQTTWSSRGPCFDGGRGVSISAPGAAIAPVPAWTLNCKQLMNGTSMSSPNAAGGISLLVSRLRKEGIPITPVRIRRALENTATPVADVDPLTLGHGLINIQGAFNTLLTRRDDPFADISFEVRVDKKFRGILLREPYQFEAPACHSVRITPKISDDDDNVAKSKLELHLALHCDSPWVTFPSTIVVCNDGRTFSVSVDASALEHGRNHYTEIYATDRCDDYVLFRIPVSVIKPVVSDAAIVEQNNLEFHPGKIVRQFLAVPRTASAAKITVISQGNVDPRQFVLHTLYHLPQTSHRETSLRSYIMVHGTRSHVSHITVVGGTTIEITLAQFWSALGTTKASIKIEWIGLSVRPTMLFLSGADRICRFDVGSSIRSESLKPTASLKSWVATLAPVSPASLRALSQRDTFPNQRHSYELILTYKFTQAVSCSVTVEVPLLCHHLYEAEFDSQMCHVFDAGKMRVAVFDAFPKAVTLDKGDYTIRVQIRHDERKRLQLMSTMPIHIVRSLSKAIDLELHRNFSNAITAKKGNGKGKSPFANEILHVNETVTCFATLMQDAVSIPKGFNSSCLFRGNLLLCEDAALSKAIDIPVVVSSWLDVPVPKSLLIDGEKKSSPPSDDEEEKTPSTALRDCILNWLEKQSAADMHKYGGRALDLVVHEFPKHLRTLTLQLKAAFAKYTDCEVESDREQAAQTVLSASSSVLDLIDTTILACDCGRNPPSGQKGSKLTHSIQERKKALCLALSCKATVLVDSKDPDNAAIESVVGELKKWVEWTGEPEYLALAAKYYTRKGLLGHALQILNSNDPATARDKKLHTLRQEALHGLHWQHWATIQDHRHLLSSRSDWALF
ncbi:Tripeptidyl-peptidase II [Plasmodiophora brassicae]